MDKMTIATLMISVAAGTTHAFDSSIITTENKVDVESISLLCTKKGDIILMEDGNKVVGLLDGDPKLRFSFGEIVFPKNDIAMIFQDIDDHQRIHIVTTSGQSYVGSPLKESIRAYSINEDQTKEKLDSFIALLPEKSNGVFQPDDSPLYSIRFNNGDRLTAVILDQNIHINDGYKTTTITPQQIVKLSKNEGIQIQNRRNVERKFGSYISDKYLTVVIPASDQHFKLQWELIDKVQKYDPMYDEETFEAIATVLKPLYKNVHRKGVWTAEFNDQRQDTQETNELAGINVNNERLEFDSVGYSNSDVSHVAVNIEDDVEVITDAVDSTTTSEEVVTSVESDEIVVSTSDYAEPLFVDEQNFELSDEIVVTDFVYDMGVTEKLVAEYFVTEESFLENFQEIQQLFDEALDFEVSEELVITDFEGDDFMLVESEEVSAPDVVSESILEDEELLAGDSEEINVDEIDEMIVESSLDEFEQLFDETLDLDVGEELVITDFENDDFMLAESEGVSAPDIVSEFILEDEELLIGDLEEINIDEIDELIAESDLDEFEKLFDEILGFDVSNGMDDLIALNEDAISKGVSQEVIDELHDMLMNDQEIDEISDGQEVDVAESETIELSITQENDEVLPQELLDKLGIILSDGWSDNPVSEDKISAGFVVIRQQLIEVDEGPSPYIIGKSLVTNSEYDEFAEATGYRRPSKWKYGEMPENQGDKPITDVSKEDAKAYAAWKKKRLPTRKEIETALELGIISNDENFDELLDSSVIETDDNLKNAPKVFRLAEDIKSN